MSRNPKKGNADIAKFLNKKKASNPNKVNKYGKMKSSGMSKENQFLSESDSFKSTTNNLNEDTCEDICDDIDDELSESNDEECSGGTSSYVFPFDLAMWDVSLIIKKIKYKLL